MGIEVLYWKVVVLDYYSLELQILKGPEGSINLYRALILEKGETKAIHDFEIKYDLKLTQMLENIEEKVIFSGPQPEEKNHIEFGKMLYATVFSGELGEYFNKRFSEAQERDYGLRISLQFSDEVPEIASLPWEYLHNGENFLVTRRSILVSRLPLGVKKTESKPLDSILRMLVIISSPDDPRISPLNTEKEQEIILESLDKLQKEQKIKVDFTEDATFENIQNYLNEQDYQIVHFTGHGISIKGVGHLVFESEDRKARFINNQILADLLSEMGIRLVVLSSCESAKASNKEVYSDLASTLSKSRIPAVVAMQYSVLDDVAIKFAYTFYRTIAYGKDIDVALKEARIIMKDSEKSNGLDFATPVLYLSDPNCVQVENIKPEPVEFVTKPIMLPDLQVMKKGFVARSKELRIIERGFRSDLKRAVIIHGFGGIGKTVLASRFALKMSEYFDGVFGMRCTSTTQPEDILNKINGFLMMKGKFELNQIINQQVPLEVKTSLLVNILNQFRILIILDNFEDCLDEDQKHIQNPQLKELINHLLNNTINNTKFIITTRYDFDPLEGRLSGSIEHIPLPELNFPQTIWMMNNYTELAELEISKKKEIYAVIGGHPWTVGQFAKHAAFQGVDSLLLDLKPLKKELIKFTLLDKSFLKLDDSAKKLLLYASIYEEVVPIEALSWIIGDEKDESPSIGNSIQKLIQWGLIYKELEYNPPVYTEHTLVRDFARNHLEEELDKKKLLIRAAKYYENLAFQTRDLWDYLKARNNYYKAEEWEIASEITQNIWQYLVSWGHNELAMNLLNESIKTTSDITKVNLEFLLGNTYQLLGDWREALKIYKDSINKSILLGNYKLVPYILKTIGMIYMDQGNPEEAIKFYKQSSQMEEELGGESDLSPTLQLMGMFHQEQGNYEKAIILYHQSLEVSKKVGDKGRKAHTLYTLGNLHQDQGNYEEAFSLYNQSLEISIELANKNGIAQVLQSLGMLNQRQGNIDEAVKHLNESLKISEESGNKNIIARTLNCLGKIHFQQGNFKEAIKLYNESSEVSKDLGDKGETALTLRYLGEIYQLQGDYLEATDLFKQSLRLEEEMGHKMGIAQTLCHLGNVYNDQENDEEAIKMYYQSLNISKELGNKSGIASVLYEVGLIFQNQGRYEEAISLYKRSLKDSEDLGERHSVATTLHAIGNVHSLRGDYEECIRLHNQALGISQEIGYKSQTALILQSQGKVCQKKNDYDNAVKFYSQSLEISKELGQRKLIENDLHYLGMIHQDQGNYEESMKLFNQLLKMKEETGDKSEIAGVLNNIGGVQREKREYVLSLKAYLRAFSIFKEINSPQYQTVEKNISYLKGELGEKEFNALLEKWRVDND